ncbi:hypothetical protein BRARA_K00734, partial [Brassica rapa]
KKPCGELTNTLLFDCDSVFSVYIFFILLIYFSFFRDRPWQGTCSDKKPQMSLSSTKASSESYTSKSH